MHFADLCSYLDYLESIREVRRITHPVALDLEIGAISRRAGGTGAAAPLFENIAERLGTRVLGAPGAVSARPGPWLAWVASVIGLAPTASGRDERYIRGVDRRVTDSDLRVCTSCFQNRDGSIQGDNRDGDEGPRVCLERDADLNADQARELAALLLELAAHIDGWVTR